MFKFEYKTQKDIDLDVITKKASNYIVNKRSLTNKYSTFTTFSEYFDAMVETKDNSSHSRYKIGIIFRNLSNGHSQPCNLKPVTRNGNGFFSDASFKYPFDIKFNMGKFSLSENTMTVTDTKNLFTSFMANNIYLGTHEGRIYTVLQHCVDHDDMGYVAVESYPIELLYSSFTKDYYNFNQYYLFEQLFNERTITIIPKNGNTFTFKPKNLTFIKDISPVGFSKSIGQNRNSLVKRISGEIDLDVSFNSDKHSYLMCSVLYTLSLIVPNEVVDTISKNIPVSNENNSVGNIMDMSLTEVVEKYNPDAHYEVKQSITKLFDNDITDEFTLRHLFGIISVAQLSNGVNGSLFFTVDDFMGYDSDNYFMECNSMRKLPIKSLINTKRFMDGRLVKMTYNDDTDECVFSYTDIGRDVVNELLERVKRIKEEERGIDDYDLLENLLHGKLLSMHYYMSEPFLKDVIYPVYVDKENIKTFLKGCYYEQN